ncbi:hypothetical protein LFM09_29885 [Lentzea alba]|uniref:SdrD B-like domain-containing protein n=1 Tax=Lentzea alba TaxID=2714351 RepID=UPI0039BFCAF0
MKPTRVLAALAAALIPIIGLATPAAQAHHTCWIDGADMPTTTDVGCRDSFVLDPGFGRLLSHQDFIRHRDYYQARGFHPNFIWYARIENRQVTSGDVEWSGCDDNNRVVDVPCAPHLLHFKPVWNPFHARPVTLPSLSFGTSFIGQACGNFSKDTSAKPVPVISGHKYHDANRNGVRDAGEPGLAGWTMTLHRDRSDAGQGTGAVEHRTTDANGYYEFRMDGHLPGDYAITEENRPDWTRTSGPERHGVHVPIGAADTEYRGRDFGNVETKADAVKVAFDVVAPPSKLTADTEQTLRVRAVLENRGPAPIIDVQDTITAHGEVDCTFRQPQQAVTRRLVLGVPVEVIFEVQFTCTEPSFHRFTFDNALDVTTPGVTDPDPSSNRRSVATTIPVHDESDVGVTSTQLDCVSRTYVTDHFECTVTATVSNGGDHTPALTDIVLGLTGPQDCTLTPVGTTRHEKVEIATSATVVSKWDVTCANRSYHDFAASAEAVLNHLHVDDPNPANNTGSATDQVEVFERVDLSVSDIRLTCTERQYQTQTFDCTTTTTVANAGPADAVQTLTTVTFAAPADCTITPNTGQQQSHVLNAGTTATFTKAWTVSCTENRRHLLSTAAVIAANEPHPEDTDRANDTRSIDWVPPDVKPRSFPSSINIKKEGLIPVAILSTAEFDAVARVDRTSLTFGATGLEQSFVRCGSPGEDVNDDGRADLVCHFDTTKTGLTCGMTTATLMGRTTDGRRFEGQDDIKLTGC